MAVSKTDFMRGMQCRKMLWLDKNRPELKVIPPEVQARLDAGNEFGDEAMGMFGPFVEVTAYREDGRLDFAKMIKDTKDCLDEGIGVICEASFSFYGNFCSVDILRRTDVGYELYEVKNSPEVTVQHLKDVGFQRYIATKCGVKIVKCFVVYAGDDGSFMTQDVTREAAEYSRWVNDYIWQLGKVRYEKQEPQVQVGNHCTEPYECWYYGYCHGTDK